MAERGKELKNLLMRVKEESEKDAIQSHRFMAIDGEAMERVTDFIFLGSKIPPDGDCRN